MRVATYTRVAVGVTLCIAGISASGCATGQAASLSPDQARDALVSTVENTSKILDVEGWTWDGAPEVGNCGQRRGERANYTYGYGAPAPDSDREADANIVADYWTSLGMQVRVVDTPLYVVYASGGPVSGLSFSTAPGDYYIAGTSLCVPGDGADIRKQDNG